LSQLLPLPEKAHVRVTIDMEEMTDTERAEWLKLSARSLMQAWDNPDDDVFNELLQK
jgi:hypothetical protein